MKKLSTIMVLVGLIGLCSALPVPVHAQTSSYNATVSVDGSNNVLINGRGTASDYIANGDTVSVTLTNSSSSNVVLCSKGSAPQPIAGGGSGTLSVTPNGEAEIDVILSSGGCSGGGTSASLYIEAASGTISCVTSSNQVWNVTGQYSHVPPTTSLYRNGVYVASVPSSAVGTYYNNSVNEQFAAQTTAATYALYDGTNNTNELIGQTVCPAATVAATKTTSSTPKSTTSPTTATATATATPTAVAIDSTTQSPTTDTGSTTQPASSKVKVAAVKNSSAKKVSSNNSARYVSGGVILAVIVGLVALHIFNIWRGPQKLLVRLRNIKK